MTEREFKVIRQRIAVELDNHQDARDLANEIGRLRLALRDVQGMTGDPAIQRFIQEALGDQ